MSRRRVRPYRLRLEASSACQLKCPDCPTAGGETKPVLGTGHLRLENFRKLLAANPRLRHVELSNYGELFLNPELAGILQHAHERGVMLTADNGANLNHVRDGVLEALVRYRMRRITCSIDGATPETYAQYRIGGNLEKVLSHIRAINGYKAKYRSRYPELTWQFVVFPHNRHEAGAARELARELGMRFYEKLAWVDAPPELVQIEPAGGPANRSEYREKYGLNYMRHLCHQLWAMPQVNWDGKMLGCCRNYWGEFGGNIFEDGLEAAANGERIEYARRMLEGRAPARDDIPCTRCELYEDLARSGEWLRAGEMHIPSHVITAWNRRGWRHPLLLRAAGGLFRLAEAAYYSAMRLRRGGGG